MRWIIGDIHGMYRMLLAVVEAVQQRDRAPRFYFVGDYVNRGPESRQVVELLLSLPDARFVRGNHDEVFDIVVNGQSFVGMADISEPVDVFLRFLQFGLVNTLTSYGIDLAMIEQVSRRPSSNALANLLEPIPSSHRTFFRNLPAIIDEPDLLVAHAKWDVDRANHSSELAKLEQSSDLRHQLLWSRFAADELYRRKTWTRPAVFGHTPVGTYARSRQVEAHVPISGPSIVLLDTGAALSMHGRLTAYCVEEHGYIQVDRAGAILSGHL